MSWHLFATSRSGHYAVMNWLEKNGVENITNAENRNLAPEVIDHAIILMRDPFNWLASWAGSYERGPNAGKWYKNDDIVNYWIKYAREVLGDSRVLNGGFHFISYNRWFADKEYRRQLIEDVFDSDFTDKGLQDVIYPHNKGWASTFDGKKFHGNAQQMGVLTRWRHMMDNETYLNILRNHPQLIELGKRLFNGFAPQEVMERL